MESMGVEQTEFSVKDLMFVQHTFPPGTLNLAVQLENSDSSSPFPPRPPGHLGSLLYLSRIVGTGRPALHF